MAVLIVKWLEMRAPFKHTVKSETCIASIATDSTKINRPEHNIRMY